MCKLRKAWAGRTDRHTHTHTHTHGGPTPSGHILITRHSCPHLRNWSCDGVRFVRATAIVFPASMLPAPGLVGRLPSYPIIKPNDSICALFNFDVPVMYYTIRLIWQFPLHLIKYLWSEVEISLIKEPSLAHGWHATSISISSQGR